MKIDRVCHWMCIPIADIATESNGLRMFLENDGPWEITGEDLVRLSDAGFDVAIMHIKQQQPTKRALRRGAKEVPPLKMLALDNCGGKFRQR